MINYYDSIYDTPAYIWYQVNKSKDFTFLIKNKIGKKRFKNEYVLSICWKKIFSEYIEEFPPLDYINKLKAKYNISKLRFEAAAYGDVRKNTIADIQELKLKEDKKVSDIDFYGNCVVMQQHLGFKINPRTITIFKYFNNLRILNKDNGE